MKFLSSGTIVILKIWISVLLNGFDINDIINVGFIFSPKLLILIKNSVILQMICSLLINFFVFLLLLNILSVNLLLFIRVQIVLLVLMMIWLSMVLFLPFLVVVFLHLSLIGQNSLIRIDSQILYLLTIKNKGKLCLSFFLLCHTSADVCFFQKSRGYVLRDFCDFVIFRHFLSICFYFVTLFFLFCYYLYVIFYVCLGGVFMGKVLVACERSQVVCSAFRSLGVEAYSCDILPPYGSHPEWHIQDDAIRVAYSGDWSLMIAHPPCTYLSNAGNASLYLPDGSLSDARLSAMASARDFFLSLLQAPIPRVCVENPKPTGRSCLPPCSQVIQPYYFGDPYSKYTMLWLRNLPGLLATCICEEYVSWHALHSSPTVRSRTFPGVASAMASQWMSFV